MWDAVIAGIPKGEGRGTKDKLRPNTPFSSPGSYQGPEKKVGYEMLNTSKPRSERRRCLSDSHPSNRSSQAGL